MSLLHVMVLLLITAASSQAFPLEEAPGLLSKCFYEGVLYNNGDIIGPKELGNLCWCYNGIPICTMKKCLSLQETYRNFPKKSSP